MSRVTWRRARGVANQRGKYHPKLGPKLTPKQYPSSPKTIHEQPPHSCRRRARGRDVWGLFVGRVGAARVRVLESVWGLVLGDIYLFDLRSEWSFSRNTHRMSILCPPTRVPKSISHQRRKAIVQLLLGSSWGLLGISWGLLGGLLMAF